MGNLFAELKRRHIYRVAAAYAVVAWVLIQLVNNITPMLKLPDWVGTALLVLLLIGFPVALLFAWINQLAPADGSAARATTGKLDWVLIGALVVVIALVSYQQLAPTRSVATAQQANVAPGPANTAGISVAVLPFVNLSGDATQEFFSDGMTEEITSALAKVPNLQVVGRTSAFQFKGENKDLTAIGQALHVTHLIEGSVRKDGNEVRITAQLIRADNGTHLWTESYNRELKGVFAVQEEIASAIAGALRVPLGLKQGETLISNRTDDTESYQNYLRAKALVRARGLQPLTEAAALLEQVVARDPNYAPAWSLLALAYALTPNFHPAYNNGSVDELRRIVDASFPRAEAAARRAIQLDPNHADGFMSLGLAQERRGNLLMSEDTFKQALALDPNNPEALNLYRNLLLSLGRLKEGLAMSQRVQALEPFVPVFSGNTTDALWLNGQDDAAITILKNLPQDYLSVRYDLARIYSTEGRYREAAQALEEVPSGAYLPGQLEAAVRLLRTAPATAASPQSLPRLGSLDFVYLPVGASNRTLDFYEGTVGAGFRLGMSQLWHRSYAPLRKTERFKALVRANGLVDYWRARGWPDLCRPMGADDFVCD